MYKGQLPKYPGDPFGRYKGPIPFKEKPLPPIPPAPF